MYRICIPAILILLVTFPSSAVVNGFDEEHQQRSPANSITVEELRNHIFYLASDELEGRMTGTEGYEIAAKYAATQFRAAGAEPAALNGDGSKSFLQVVPFVQQEIADGCYVKVKSGEGESTFSAGEDFLLMPFRRWVEEEMSNLQPVFAGYGIHEPEAGWDDYEGIDVEGKLVLILSGVPMKDGKPVLPEEMTAGYSVQFERVVRKVKTAIEQKATALAFLANAQEINYWRMIRSELYRKRTFYLPPESDQLHQMIPDLLLNADIVKALFENQDVDQFELQRGSEGKYESFDLQDVLVDLKVNLNSSEVKSYNVAAFVPGSDPDLKEQVVVLGAHLDHVGIMRGEVLNGADDNASGSAAVLEIAEAVAMNPPGRSVLFVLFTAEEIGKYGSYHFVNNCPVPLQNIVVSINLDCVGRTSGFRWGKSNALYAFGLDKRYPRIYELFTEVNERTVNLPVDLDDPDHFFMLSDHYNFYLGGIPAVFFSTGIHSDLHQPTDDPEKISYDRLQDVSQLVYELVMELGNRDEPLPGRN